MILDINIGFLIIKIAKNGSNVIFGNFDNASFGKLTS